MVNKIFRIERRENKSAFMPFDLERCVCANCLQMPSSHYAPLTYDCDLTSNWYPARAIPDMFLCVKCFELLKRDAFELLDARRSEDINLKMIPGITMIDIYRMINRIMVGRRWITPEVNDYRLDRTEGLDVGSLPAVPKVERQLSDAHAYFEQGVSEPADLGEYRQRFASRYSWAIPTLSVLEEIRRRSPDGVVDFGAGTGYWSALLNVLGCKVRSIDVPRDDLRFVAYNHLDEPQWVSIERNPSRVGKGTSRMTLLLVWPPETSDMAAEALHRWDGQCVVYVGEGPNGSTASTAFFKRLFDGFVLTREMKIPTFYGYFDRCLIFDRK